MSSTVTDARHRVSDATAKKNPGSFKRAARRVFAAQPREDTETPLAPEPFVPDEQARWVASRIQAAIRPLAEALAQAQQPEKPQPVQGDAALYNTHPKPQLRRLAHLALDLEADPTLGFRDCVERLHEVMDEFSAGALAEFQAQQLWEKRTGEGQVAVRRKAQQLLATAADGGEDAELKTARVVTASGEVSEYLPGAANKILANAMRASDPKPTALQVKMTPEVLARIDAGEPAEVVEASVTATAALSPVHVPGDGMTPPVPATEESAEPGALKPLPKRVPQATTHMVLPATDHDPYETVDPTLNGHTLTPGAWVYDEGTGTTGPVWFLLAEQNSELRDSGRVAVLRFANGQTRDVHAGARVRVLDVRRAQVLVAQIEARLAARCTEDAA